MVKNRGSKTETWIPENVRAHRQEEEGRQQWKLWGVCGVVKRSESGVPGISTATIKTINDSYE